MSTIERLAKMAQETTPDQWVSIFSELHEQIVDLEQQLEAAERRDAEQDKGIVLTEAEREALKRAAQIVFDHADSLPTIKERAAIRKISTVIDDLLARAGATSPTGKTEKADAAE